MNPIIEFKDYSFKYRAQTEPTIKDINLCIYPDEKVLIIGASGSGKSTLAHCINGLAPHSYSGDVTGNLTIDGMDPGKLGIFGMSKIVGTVLQDTDGQFIGLTVAEDIAFALENDNTSQQVMKEKVKNAANMVNVENLLSSSPEDLSGGQKQRVSMAGVMVDDVKILLFDEPLANLDPATGKQAISMIDSIHKHNKSTIIIIEHRLEDVLYRDVDRIILIEEGRIVSDTKPDVLLSGNLLLEKGIREPLYLTAIKHAGCQVQEESRPQHIETMEISTYQQSIQNWFETTQSEDTEHHADTVLTVNKLCFSYVHGKHVLEDINFVLKKGEMVSIVGKNGAGKSTLSHIICGFYKQNSGDIMLNNKDITNMSIKERGEKIGLVMQNPNQMISKPKIFDEVALGLKVRGVPEEEIKERVYEVLKTCGLYPFRNWPISALSFGQKKRVTIASILVMNPEIMILDEPTAGQDYKHYTEIMEFLKKINEAYHITIVMITHDMHLMLEYTQRAIVIADGRMLADDTPAHILTNPTLAKKAYLKQTSLYDLSLKCGIDNPSEFVKRFIDYERKHGRPNTGG